MNSWLLIQLVPNKLTEFAKRKLETGLLLKYLVSHIKVQNEARLL